MTKKGRKEKKVGSVSRDLHVAFRNEEDLYVLHAL